MTLEDMLKTLRTAQYERVEIRDDYGNEILTCPVSSDGVTPYAKYSVTEWFPHGAPNKDATFTVYVRKEEIREMTNKEAIRWLLQIKDRYIHGGDDSFDASRREAIDRAVQGLKFIEDSYPKTFEDYLHGEEI